MRHAGLHCALRACPSLFATQQLQLGGRTIIQLHVIRCRLGLRQAVSQNTYNLNKGIHMRIALIQQHAGSDRSDNLVRALTAMGEAKEQGAELCAFAELAIDQFFPAERSCSWAAGSAETIPGPSADAI